MYQALQSSIFSVTMNTSNTKEGSLNEKSNSGINQHRWPVESEISIRRCVRDYTDAIYTKMAFPNSIRTSEENNPQCGFLCQNRASVIEGERRIEGGQPPLTPEQAIWTRDDELRALVEAVDRLCEHCRAVKEGTGGGGTTPLLNSFPLLLRGRKNKKAPSSTSPTPKNPQENLFK